MAVLKMQKISICGLKKDRKAVLEKLQSMGLVELIPVESGEQFFSKMDTESIRQSCEKHAALTEQALDVLGQYVPEERSLLASLKGKMQIEKKEFQNAISHREEIMDTAKKIIGYEKNIAAKRGEIQICENQLESLAPWIGLDVPMNAKGTKSVSLFVGTMPAGMTVEEIYERLGQRCPAYTAASIHIIHSESDAQYIALLCMKSDAGVIEEALRAEGFAAPVQFTDQVPGHAKAELEARIGQLESEIELESEKIISCAHYRIRLKELGDYFRMRADRYRALGMLPQSQSTFLLCGYAPKRDVPLIEEQISSVADCMIAAEDPREDEETPVLLQNHPFSSSVEGVLESYGLPQRNGIDPTAVMSFFYVFFFGMMLSDAAYGAIIAGSCLWSLRKFPGMKESLKKSIRMFLYCGISTMIWGILFGGYFGNVVDIVSETFFGRRVTIPALWFVPLDDPMKLLIYSLAFGVIHLLVGLGMKGYLFIREGRVSDFFCDVVLWYALLAGLLLMLLPTDVFASIAQVQIVFPPGVGLLARGLALVGAAGILLMSGRKSKNPVLRLALGAYDLYNVTGWLSDTLSYSRLLALGLATGVIASVVNEMGSMFGGGASGAVLFAIVFVAGHTLNLGINLLGAYVHTNRLQFVEFFGKFYEGGGRPFEPFRENTKHIEIKEEPSL